MSGKFDIFNPFRDGKTTDFFPEQNCEFSKLYVHVCHIWTDISSLFDILQSRNEEYEKKLLTKYILIELLSLDTNLKLFINMVSREKKEFLGDDKIKRLKRMKKDYLDLMKPIENMKTVRDKIAAHRDFSLELIETREIWESIEINVMIKPLSKVPEILEYIRSFRIFWFNAIKPTEEGVVVTNYFPEDFEKECLPREE